MPKQLTDGDSESVQSFLDSAEPVYSTRADALLGLNVFHVLRIETTLFGMRVDVETDTTITGRANWGAAARLQHRCRHCVHDATGSRGPVELVCHKRIWRCGEPPCPVSTFMCGGM